MTARTIYQVLETAARKYGSAPALRQPQAKRADGYLTYSWIDYKRAVDEIAAGLHELGLGKGDVVAINSETRLEFYIADQGIIANGSIAAALYPSYPAEELVSTIEKAGAKAVFVENAKMLLELKDARVRHWILLTGWAEHALSLEDLREMGREAIRRDPEAEALRIAEVSPFDPAILYLTSGATGQPKMALVTQHAVTSNTEAGTKVLHLGPSDATVAFLPAAHIAQRVSIEFLPLEFGMPVTFFESLLRLPQDIKRVRPTLLLAPPRMWERIYTTICTELRKKPAAARKAFYAALGLALAAARYRRAGKPVPMRIRGPLAVADRVLFRRIRARFGGRLRMPASGAAPLSKDLAEFYEAIGMPLVEGYGLTEGGVTTLNPVDNPMPGSIGKALPGVEAMISEDGEVLFRSPTLFYGYLNDPDATAEVMRGGWLHTGDLGHIDDAGFIYITGRKKELIVSSTGKKIHPAHIENRFHMEPIFSQVLLIGDGLPYLVALFTINPVVAQSLPGMEAYSGGDPAVLAAAPAVSAEVRAAVVRVNTKLAHFEQVRKYRVLPREFSIDAGELTATMKVRRTHAIRNFQKTIDELYAGR